jgi:hypothetical protein
MVGIHKSNTLHVNIKKRKRLVVFFLFLLFSSLLWLLIKLSSFYTLGFDVQLKIVNPPADIWISDEASTHSLKAIINAKGFQLIKISYFSKKPVEIKIPLSTVPFRKQNQHTYYINTLNIKEFITADFGISENDISFSENEINFNVEPIFSAIIPVSLAHDFHFKDQFGQYGDIKLNPETVEVFAPKHILDTLTFVTTELIEKKGILESFSGTAKIVFDENKFRPLNKYIDYEVNVEKFTESKVKIRVQKPAKPLLKVFPDHVEIFYNVATKDFDKINTEEFIAEIDTNGLFDRKQFLNIRVLKMPVEVQINRVSPERVEYLILKK